MSAFSGKANTLSRTTSCPILVSLPRCGSGIEFASIGTCYITHIDSMLAGISSLANRVGLKTVPLRSREPIEKLSPQSTRPYSLQ